jgi:hypothetical protein
MYGHSWQQNVLLLGVVSPLENINDCEWTSVTAYSSVLDAHCTTHPKLLRWQAC